MILNSKISNAVFCLNGETYHQTFFTVR